VNGKRRGWLRSLLPHRTASTLCGLMRITASMAGPLSRLCASDRCDSGAARSQARPGAATSPALAASSLHQRSRRHAERAARIGIHGHFQDVFDCRAQLCAKPSPACLPGLLRALRNRARAQLPCSRSAAHLVPGDMPSCMTTVLCSATPSSPISMPQARAISTTHRGSGTWPRAPPLPGLPPLPRALVASSAARVSPPPHLQTLLADARRTANRRSAAGGAALSSAWSADGRMRRCLARPDPAC